MKTKSQELSPTTAAFLLLFIVALSSLLLVPGTLPEKMEYIAKLKKENGTAMFALLIVCVLNSTLIIGALLSYFNIGRLGSKIQQFSKYAKGSKRGPEEEMVFFISALSALIVVRCLIPSLPELHTTSDRELALAGILLTTAYVLSVWGTGIIFYYGIYSAMGFLKKQSGRKIPAVPTGNNRIILGTINEI